MTKHDTGKAFENNESNKTTTMLSLAMAQIEAAVQDGEQEVNQVVESFVNLVSDSREILSRLSDDIAQHAGDPIQQRITEVTDDICTRVNRGVIALQFYDRLSQRLEHVTHLLTQVSKIKEKGTENDWNDVCHTIRAKYTMEVERSLFDAIIEGNTVNHALQMIRITSVDRTQADDDVELF